MKENSIEELRKKLEELYKTQQARLDVGADDLDIREEIAEVEEQIKELQDETSDEADIKEDIEIFEKIIKSYKEADKCGLSNNDFKNEIKALEHILQDYRRVLKENEELKEYIAIAPNLDEMTATKYRSIQQDAYIQGRAEEQQKAEQIIYENYIPKQKVKDKIEEIGEKIKYEQNEKVLIQLHKQIKILKELLEESEENNGE